MDPEADGSSPAARQVRIAEPRPPSIQPEASNPSSSASSVIQVARGHSQSPPSSDMASVDQIQRFDDEVDPKKPSSPGGDGADPPAPNDTVPRRVVTIRLTGLPARNELRDILSRPPRLTLSATDSYSPLEDNSDEENFYSHGPNPKGTYSKEYTLQHPEIKWIHRGQGRYLPESEMQTIAVAPRRSQKSSEMAAVSEAQSDEQLEQMISLVADHLDNYRRAQNPLAREKGSPSFRHQVKLITNLLRNNARHNWPGLIEQIGDPGYRDVVRKWNRLMDQTYPRPRENESESGSENELKSRSTRQSKSFQTSEGRRSTRLIDHPRQSFAESVTDDEYDESNDGDVDEGPPDDDNEYVVNDEPSNPGEQSSESFYKSYAVARPDESFHHLGNMSKRRGSRTMSTRRSSRAQDTSGSPSANNGSDASYDLPPGVYCVRHEDLPNYPGMTFHHTGHGSYRPGPTPKGGTSITVSESGKLLPWRRGRESDTALGSDTSPKRQERRRMSGAGRYTTESEDDEIYGKDEVDRSIFLTDPKATVSKAYALKHPEVGWKHIRFGRFRPHTPGLHTRRDSDAADAPVSATPSGSSTRRSSRNDGSFATDDVDNYSHDDIPPRESRRKRESRAAAEADDEETGALFDKAYVDAHPDEEFHHRGQGRYARGPRIRPSATTPVLNDQDADGLVDSAYVHQHPNETFHHRGQGKWARGLPPPGSSNKVAVRGPGAKDKMEAEKSGDVEDEDGNKPPGPTALVLRADGPEKWPHLQWHYRGGGKWCRMTKDQVEKAKTPPLRIKRPRLSTMGGDRSDAAESQLLREADAMDDAEPGYRSPRRRRGFGTSRGLKNRNDDSGAQTGASMRSKFSSPMLSKAPSPRPPLLSPEEDILAEEDLPGLYKDEHSSDSDEDPNDEADQILRKSFRPMVSADLFVKALTKHDPAVRSLDNLKMLAENAQWALKQMQDEYLKIDKIVSQHPMPGKKERKPFRGGRAAIDKVIFEDKKEATLYDYTFDPRKIGYQDPDAQRIVRDADGRELRRRRKRAHAEVDSDYPGPEPSERDAGTTGTREEVISAKRVVKPVSRFDGVVAQPAYKRARLASSTSIPRITLKSTSTTARTAGRATSSSYNASPRMTPDPPYSSAPVNPPVQEQQQQPTAQQQAAEYRAPTRGRWKDHVPKRIRELRGESVGSNPPPPPQQAPRPSSVEPRGGSPKPPGSTGARKGRPPGSKNLHKRKDAGIKKGPRKAKLLTPEGSVALAATVVAARSMPNHPAGLSDDASSSRAASDSVEPLPPPPPPIQMQSPIYLSSNSLDAATSAAERQHRMPMGNDPYAGARLHTHPGAITLAAYAANRML